MKLKKKGMMLINSAGFTFNLHKLKAPTFLGGLQKIVRAPAAFGLVSFLMHEGLDRLRIRKHLAIFSASAPLLTVITYLVLSMQSKENLTDIQTTGIAMLFSAGTFLYVATVHVLPEISVSQTQHKAADGTVVVREQKGFKITELVALVLGAIIPVVLALGHKH